VIPRRNGLSLIPAAASLTCRVATGIGRRVGYVASAISRTIHGVSV
jgi:hypothetical protein